MRGARNESRRFYGKGSGVMERLTHEADFGFDDCEQTLYEVPSDKEGSYDIYDIAMGFCLHADEQYNRECQEILENISLKLKHYEDLADQDRLVDIETYQQRLIRYIDAGKYRNADKKVFSENDVVYLIEHGIFPCKSEAERALERKG